MLGRTGNWKGLGEPLSIVTSVRCGKVPLRRVSGNVLFRLKHKDLEIKAKSTCWKITKRPEWAEEEAVGKLEYYYLCSHSSILN